jgi:hypothetical protein
MGESDQSIEKKVSSSAKLFVLSKLYFQRKDDHNGNKPRNAMQLSLVEINCRKKFSLLFIR